MGEDAYEQLAGRYGYAAHEVLAVAAERGELAQPILPGMPDLLAEAVFAARREQARSVADVLLRRTRLGLTAARGAAARPASRRRSGSRGRWGPSWAGTRRAARAEAERFRAEAAAEGLVVGSGTTVGPAP